MKQDELDVGEENDMLQPAEMIVMLTCVDRMEMTVTRSCLDVLKGLGMVGFGYLCTWWLASWSGAACVGQTSRCCVLTNLEVDLYLPYLKYMCLPVVELRLWFRCSRRMLIACLFVVVFLFVNGVYYSCSTTRRSKV